MTTNKRDACPDNKIDNSRRHWGQVVGDFCNCRPWRTAQNSNDIGALKLVFVFIEMEISLKYYLKGAVFLHEREI